MKVAVRTTKMGQLLSLNVMVYFTKTMSAHTHTHTPMQSRYMVMTDDLLIH